MKPGCEAVICSLLCKLKFIFIFNNYLKEIRVPVLCYINEIESVGRVATAIINNTFMLINRKCPFPGLIYESCTCNGSETVACIVALLEGLHLPTHISPH